MSIFALPKAEEMTAEQNQAADPTWAAAHPEEAALNHYYNPFYGGSSKLHQWGEEARKAMLQPNWVGNVLNHGSGPGALLGAAAGGLAGAGIGAFQGHPARMGILAALLGAGIGAYSGAQRTKAASGWRSSINDSREQLAEAIADIPGLGFNQKAKFLAAVPELSNSQVHELISILSSVGGFAAGAAVSRFLLGAGLLGTAAGGFLGALIGSSMRSPRGAGGYESLGNTDFRGNSIF